MARALMFVPGSFQQFARFRRTGVLGNTLWLLVDKSLRSLLLMFVAALLARKLGPDDFGLFSFAMALVLLLGSIATLGLENVVVRDVVLRPERRGEILASAFMLRLVAGTIAGAICVVIAIVWRAGEPRVWWLIGLLALTLPLQATDTIVYGYQADVNAKPVVLLRNATLVVGSLLRMALIVAGVGLIPLALTFVLDPFLFAGLLIWRSYGKQSALALQLASLQECRRLLSESWPLLVAGVSIAIYMRIDQLMLAAMSGDRAVGILAAAVRVSESWYAVPTALLASLTPGLLAAFQRSEREYEQTLLAVTPLLTGLGIAAALVLTVAAPNIINLLYGPQYERAAGVLTIHVWAGVFVCLGLLASNWMVTTGRARYIMWQTILGAIINVALNLVLIPSYGSVGTAIATVISQTIAAFLCNAALRDTRPIFLLQLRAFGIRWRADTPSAPA